MPLGAVAARIDQERQRKCFRFRLAGGARRCFARDPLVKIQEGFKFEES